MRIIIYGFNSFISQILLIREIISLFNLDEITLSLTLSLWITTGTITLYVARLISFNIKNTISLFHSIYPLIISFQILILRIFKNLISPIGESIDPFLKLTLITISVISYTIISSIYIISSVMEDEKKNTKKFYILDSIGFAIGALVSYFLIQYNDIKTVVLISGIINLTVIAKSDIRYRILLIISCFISLIILNHAYSLPYKNKKLSFKTDSIFGRIEVYTSGNSNYIYYNSSYIKGPQDKDEISKKSAAAALFSDENSKSICISDSLFFCLSVRKLTTEKFFYIKPDKKLTEIEKKIYAIDDREIKTIYENPLTFITNTSDNYHSIIIEKNLPSTLSDNILFSETTLKKIKKILSPDGRLIFIIPYSNSPNIYEKKAIQTLYSSLRNNFSYVDCYYDDFILIISSDRKPQKRVFNKKSFEHLYSEYILQRKKEIKYEENKNLFQLYFLVFLCELSKYSKNTSLIAEKIIKYSFLLIALIFITGFKTLYDSRMIFISSFLSTLAEITALTVYQIKTGYIYRDITFIVFSTMLGLSTGAMLKPAKPALYIIISGAAYSVLSIAEPKTTTLIIPFITAFINGMIFSHISDRQGIKAYIYDFSAAAAATFIFPLFISQIKTLSALSLLSLITFLIIKK